MSDLRTDADRVRRTLADPQRLIWRDDVEGICGSPDVCFEYTNHARCGPCAIKQATLAGVESDLTLPNLPEVYRLRRRIDALEQIAANFVGELTDSGRNRGTCLSINHDALNLHIKAARAALSEIEPQGVRS